MSARLPLLAGLALLCGSPALAEPPSTAQPVPQETHATRSVKVRASHQVDVIAPGEKIETIIDRMRASSGGSPSHELRGADQPVKPPARGGEGGAPPEGPRPPGPPNGAPAPGAQLRPDAPPPDRPR